MHSNSYIFHVAKIYTFYETILTLIIESALVIYSLLFLPYFLMMYHLLYFKCMDVTTPNLKTSVLYSCLSSSISLILVSVPHKSKTVFSRHQSWTIKPRQFGVLVKIATWWYFMYTNNWEPCSKKQTCILTISSQPFFPMKMLSELGGPRELVSA